MSAKPLTGRKVLLIFVAGFGVIFAANMALVYSATGTFPGLVVANTYVESQNFDRKTAAQEALGWRTAALYESGRLTVTVTGPDGKPVPGLRLAAIVGRPAFDRDDVHLTLEEQGGAYTAPLDLAPGEWLVEITGAEGGPTYEARAQFYVRSKA